MDNSYCYSAKCKIAGHEYDFLCIYLSHGAFSSIETFFSELERGAKAEKTLPDVILVLHSSKNHEERLNYWKADIAKKAFLERLQKNSTQFTKSIAFCSFSYKKLELDINDLDLSELDDTSLRPVIKKLMYKGLLHLLDQNNVVYEAPSGHAFRHPSGNENKLFIQTKEVANSEAQLGFVISAICHIHDQVNWRDIETFYVDSMGIYYIVRELLNFVESSARIVNFHSYGGLQELTLPVEEYFVFISASTSGSMARELRNKEFPRDRILTIIEVAPRNDENQHLIIVPKHMYQAQSLKPDSVPLSTIEIVGERFSFHTKPARQVVLGKPHQPEQLHEILEVFAIDGVKQELNTRLPNIERSKITVFDGTTLIKNSAFLKWMDDEINWNVPSSINLIVHVDDEVSAKMAEELKNKLEEPRKPGSITIVNASALDGHCFNEVTGVLIVAGFVRNGSAIRDICRDLREYQSTPEKPRHIMIGLVLPESSLISTRLKQFLERNSTDRKFGMSIWATLPLGLASTNNLWDAYSNVASELDFFEPQADLKLNSESIDAGLASLRNGLKSAQTRFVYDSAKRLELTGGFVFLPKSLEEKFESINSACILSIMSSVLQSAREEEKESISLKRSMHQPVVISPENFSRFNDGILQASILRMAKYSELDYRSDYQSSREMLELLKKIFKRNKLNYGAAAQEFAIAMAIQKLKLRIDHLHSLIDVVFEHHEEIDSDLILGTMIYLAREHNYPTSSAPSK
ncbi:MAG: hypothetical protein CMF22_12890 [Idiomarinaceae bacterium]|nr:hypothetical protein [Idiomarinaceae bacterium]|tara:strand:+ start:3245 stop:5488 length:2244 start_codon:yes stop_codon:yes gene_type:complete